MTYIDVNWFSFKESLRWLFSRGFAKMTWGLNAEKSNYNYGWERGSNPPLSNGYATMPHLNLSQTNVLRKFKPKLLIYQSNLFWDGERSIGLERFDCTLQFATLGKCMIDSPFLIFTLFNRKRREFAKYHRNVQKLEFTILESS